MLQSFFVSGKKGRSRPEPFEKASPGNALEQYQLSFVEPKSRQTSTCTTVRMILGFAWLAYPRCKASIVSRDASHTLE